MSGGQSRDCTPLFFESKNPMSDKCTEGADVCQADTLKSKKLI